MAGIYPAGVQTQAALTGAEYVDVDNGGAVKARVTTAQIGTFAVKASGTFVATDATPVVVAAPALTASSVIVFGLKTIGGTPAAPFVTVVTPGTGFSVASGASDTSTYNWKILG
jgi:hypothetical protein